jgi:hypothetical protein
MPPICSRNTGHRPIWRRTALEPLRAWGCNTIGNWSESRLIERHEMPYVVPIHIYGNFTRVSSGLDWWGKMPDPFDSAYAAAVDKLVAKSGVNLPRRPLSHRLFRRQRDDVPYSDLVAAAREASITLVKSLQ